MKYSLEIHSGSVSTNNLSRSSGLALSTLATCATVLLMACGPTTRIESSNGAGGSDPVGVGGGTNSGGTGAGTPAPEVQTLVEIDVGDVKVNVFNGFEVPEHALGITTIVQAPATTSVVGISRIRPPTGDPVVFDYSVTGKANQPFVNYGWIGAATVQSDLAQAWPVQQGLWRILLGSDGTTQSASVRAWIRKTSDGVFHGGTVDVNVFIAPNASTENYVSTVLDDLFKDYAGLKLGNVNYLPLDSTYSVIASDAQYRELLMSSEGVGSAPALNMFVIKAFGPDYQGAIGVAGGIPGSPIVHGTRMSGVAYQPSGNPAYDATVLRHEVGHLAGLFHTTEMVTTDTDPLTDTVECAADTIKSNPDACPDTSNTMFPIAYGKTDLSPGQMRVIQGSVLYRGVFSAGIEADPPSSAAAPAQQSSIDSSWVEFRSDKPMPEHPSALERVLGGVWCAHTKIDHEALAMRVAGDSPSAALRSIVEDDAHADLLRARALGAYVRASSGVERVRALELAEEIVRRDGYGVDLRAAAFDALVRFDSVRARAVSVVLSSTTSDVLRHVAQRAGRK